MLDQVCPIHKLLKKYNTVFPDIFLLQWQQQKVSLLMVQLCLVVQHHLGDQSDPAREQEQEQCGWNADESAQWRHAPKRCWKIEHMTWWEKNALLLLLVYCLRRSSSMPSADVLLHKEQGKQIHKLLKIYKLTNIVAVNWKRDWTLMTFLNKESTKLFQSSNCVLLWFGRILWQAVTSVTCLLYFAAYLCMQLHCGLVVSTFKSQKAVVQIPAVSFLCACSPNACIDFLWALRTVTHSRGQENRG